jgi:RNA polymerase sigma-70 factor, ECF subfamily
MVEDDSEVLLAKAKQGDADAFPVLFERIRPMVFAVACRIAGANDADDVVMDTCLRVWKAIPRFNERSSLKTWVYRIAHNCATDALRARQRIATVVTSTDESGGDPIQEIPDIRGMAPDKQAIDAELGSEIQRAMGKLPEEQRATMLLRFADGLSYAEVAAATGVSIGTVMSRLFNGRRKLMKLLKSSVGG